MKKLHKVREARSAEARKLEFDQRNQGIYVRHTAQEKGFSEQDSINSSNRTHDSGSTGSTGGGERMKTPSTNEDVVFRHDVFANEADYDASVACVVEQITSGAASARTPDEE